MLQEKASAVADEGMTVEQLGGRPELASDSSHLGLPTTPSIPQNNESDQVANHLHPFNEVWLVVLYICDEISCNIT